jgi:hypothetical protein
MVAWILRRISNVAKPIKSSFVSLSRVSDHRGSNSQPTDFKGTEILPVFKAKIENAEKSST